MNQESCIVLRATPSPLGLTIRDAFGYGCLRNKLVMYFHVQEAKAMQVEDAAFCPGLERRTLEGSTSCGPAPALLERNNSVTFDCNLVCFPLATSLWLFFFPQQRENSMETNKQTNMQIINMFYSISI